VPPGRISLGRYPWCSRSLIYCEDITDHIREHGDDRDLADLDAAEREIAERRSRKGGRPPKAT
jgi:hypothetical protein